MHPRQKEQKAQKSRGRGKQSKYRELKEGQVAGPVTEGNDLLSHGWSAGCAGAGLPQKMRAHCSHFFMFSDVKVVA